MISLGAAGVLTCALAACGGSTAGSGTPAGNTAASGGSSSSSDSSDSGGSVEPASSADDLAATLKGALADPTTVHLTLATEGGSGAGASSNGEGDIRTGDGGKTEAFSIAVGSGSDNVTLVFVDDVGYVKLPASSQTDPSKPWAKVSENSSNPTVKGIAQAFELAQTNASLTQYGDIVAAAQGFKATGPTEVDGAEAQGYSFTVAATDLPGLAQYGDAAKDIGDIPITMAVDAQGRPVEIEQTITITGQAAITSTTTLSKWGDDVDISAPPADEISAG